MTFFSKYRTLAIAAALVVVAFFAYSYFFTAPAAPALSASAPSQAAAADQDLINLLLTLRTIKLDAGIFSSPVFRSLQDFSTALVPEPVGRANPFAPLGNTPASGARGR